MGLKYHVIYDEFWKWKCIDEGMKGSFVNEGWKGVLKGKAIGNCEFCEKRGGWKEGTVSALFVNRIFVIFKYIFLSYTLYTQL